MITRMITRAAVAFRSGSAAALRDHTPGPDLAGMAAALAEYGTAFAALRRAGAEASLADAAAGRVFALGFALEQLSEYFRDLASRADERAQTRP